MYYDVRFNAIAPENGEPITLIINLEIQTDDRGCGQFLDLMSKDVRRKK